MTFVKTFGPFIIWLFSSHITMKALFVLFREAVIINCQLDSQSLNYKQLVLFTLVTTLFTSNNWCCRTIPV